MQLWHNNLAEVLPLDGPWQFTLNHVSGPIQVPGSWEAQGYARRVDGPATYRRTVYIPDHWAARQIQLQFDAVSYYAEIAVNGVSVGMHTGSWTAFACDVSATIRAGQTNDISVTVWKQGTRFPLRESLAGFLPDVAVMFGGIWQTARLVAYEGPALSDITLLSDAASGTISVAAAAHGASSQKVTVTILAPDDSQAALWHGTVQNDRFAATIPVQAVAHWSPQNPVLYTVQIHLEGPTGEVVQVQRRTGFRSLVAQGDQLLFNGIPICVRGALNWGWYPGILCPDPDEAAIRDEFRRIRELGFNMMKLCLYVPAPRYFDIADEEGMLLWLELPLWLPQISPHLEQQAPSEYADIVAAVHHHPSIIIYSLGCELEDNVDPAWLAQLDGIVRSGTSNVLVCDNSGSGEAYGAQVDLADFEDYHFYCDTQFFQPLVDHFHRDWRPARPLIFGEFCAADDYRDLEPLIAAHGGELPWWLQEQNPIHPLSKIAHTEQHARMNALDLDVDAQTLVEISRKQSLEVRRLVLDKAHTRNKLGGYVVTGLRDTPLATSALFDDFDQHKYDPAAFQQFNDDSVLLLERPRARLWSLDGDRPSPHDPYCVFAGETAAFDLLLAHTGMPLSPGEWSWQITDGAGNLLGHGTFLGVEAVGERRVWRLTSISFEVPRSETSTVMDLLCTVEAGPRVLQRAWQLWVFPAVTQWPDNLCLYDPIGDLDCLDDLYETAVRIDRLDRECAALITNTLDDAVLGYLNSGGCVLLLQNGAHPLPAVSGPFWWHAIHLFSKHPVMNAMPHAGFLDAQFYGLASPWAIDTPKLSATLPGLANLTPIWRRLHPSQYTLADYILEADVGAGRLIATTLRFQGGLGDQPAGLRHQIAGRWLLYQLTRLATGTHS